MTATRPMVQPLDPRLRIKRQLARLPTGGSGHGLRMLIYHRVGGGTPDERDLSIAAFTEQMDALHGHDVVSLDDAVDRLAAGDERPRVVITFDDGFADVYERAWPILAERSLPFTVYLATAYVGGEMHWEGSTASAPGPALSWDQAAELAADPLCTIGNHTHRHVRPEQLTASELDDCTDAVRERLGVIPRHFTYTWGIPVTRMEPELRARFRSASTGELGVNTPGTDLMRLRRIPVRGSDPIEFFRAKLAGRLVAERLYGGIVATAKRLGLRA